MKNSYFNQQLQSSLENSTSPYNGSNRAGNSPRRVANDTQLSQRVNEGIKQNLERERNN